MNAATKELQTVHAFFFIFFCCAITMDASNKSEHNNGGGGNGAGAGGGGAKPAAPVDPCRPAVISNAATHFDLATGRFVRAQTHLQPQTRDMHAAAMSALGATPVEPEPAKEFDCHHTADAHNRHSHFVRGTGKPHRCFQCGYPLTEHGYGWGFGILTADQIAEYKRKMPLPTVPVPIPDVDNTEHCVSGTHACCGVRCALRYLHDHPDYNTETKINWVISYAIQALGLRLSTKLRPADPRSFLQMFGGLLTYALYRSGSWQGSRPQQVIVTHPAFCTVRPDVFEIIDFTNKTATAHFERALKSRNGAQPSGDNNVSTNSGDGDGNDSDADSDSGGSGSSDCDSSDSASSAHRRKQRQSRRSRKSRKSRRSRRPDQPEPGLGGLGEYTPTPDATSAADRGARKMKKKKALRKRTKARAKTRNKKRKPLLKRRKEGVSQNDSDSVDSSEDKGKKSGAAARRESDITAFFEAAQEAVTAEKVRRASQATAATDRKSVV